MPLLISLGRALVRKGLKVLQPFAELVPYGSTILEIAQGTWDDYIRNVAHGPAPGVPGTGGPVPPATGPRRVEIELRIELEALARDTPAAVRQKVEQVAEQVAGDQPPEVRQALANYLAQLPAMLRRSMRRPSDPTGTTLPGNLLLRKGEDLVGLLPPRPPRFNSGDRPLPGVDWVLDELLGIGGFGEVWKAHHAQLKSLPPVALKFCLDEQAAKALRNEAGVLDQVMQQGRNEGIVKLQQAYLQAATPCLEYEYIAGGDLAGLIQELHLKGRPSANMAGKIMRRLAAIIGTVHQQRPPIVHRDLKPANILVQKTPAGKFQFKVADFGIGQVTAREAIRTTTRGGDNRSELLTTLMQGSYTPLYASPQQVRGDPPDPSDDVYSLGVIWYQFLTGDLGSGAPSGMRWSRDLSQGGMPQNQIDLLASCFESNPTHRPANATVMAEQLARALEEKPSIPPAVHTANLPPPLPPPASSSSKPVQLRPGAAAETPVLLSLDVYEEVKQVSDRRRPEDHGRFPDAQEARRRGDAAETQLPQPGSTLAVLYTIMMPLGLIALISGIVLVETSGHYTYGYSYDGLNYTPGYYYTDKTQQGYGLLFCFLGGAAELAASILFLIWLHKAWSVVPPEYEGPSPGEAVGLLFVPVYNLYWMFRVIPGLSAALTRALQDRNPSRAHRAGYGVGLAACIVSLIPFVNAISMVLFPIWISQANRAKNRVIEERQMSGRPRPQDHGRLA